jgi:C1A family cysteine protease
MRSIAIAACCIVVLGLCLPALALDREPSGAELAKIEAIRAMAEANGWTWQAGPTSVSNLSDEEFQRLLGLRIPPDFERRLEAARQAGRLVAAPPGMFFPAVFDWRGQGGVTAVKNQGACGSCWAFCATAAFESQILIHSGPEYDISEQAVLSCNTVGDGCNGGWMETAYDIWTADGAVLEECMPYHEVDTEPCTRESCETADEIAGYYYVDDNINDLKTALLDGPVAAAMAVCTSFSSYTGGCYEDNCTDINHGVTIVGWDDNMCGGEGAWIVKNSWGPDWGDNGYVYMKYGTCYIGYGAAAINYTPGQTVHFFHDSHFVDDTAGDGDGNVETGEVIDLRITLLNIGAETATNVTGYLESMTPGVNVLDSAATYPDIPKGETRESDSPHFRFVVTPGGPSCGPIKFHLAVSSDEGISGVNIVLHAGGVATVFDDDFETDQGWTVGDAGDGAVTGIWERGDPDATWWGNQAVQPGDDHTESPGTQCYVTGRSGGSSQGTYDIDGGKTTLTSPAIDLSGQASAILTYYRWFASETGSNPNDDDFRVDISDDNGSSWTNLETVSCSAREWVGREFYLEEHVSLTNQIKIRFVAADSGVGGSIVEAAVDDFKIVACEPAVADVLDPEVTVLAPNGGEVCMYNTNYEVQWNAADNLGVVSVDILLSTDGGATFQDTIATGEANDGSYIWPVPDMDSKTARIKVVAMDAAMNQGEDLSDADFVLWGSLSDVGPHESRDVPDRLVLEVRGANPAGSYSRILFGLPEASDISLDVYDVTGRHLSNLLSGRRAEGYHTLDMSATRPGGAAITPGIYFVRLRSQEDRLAAKLVIAR